ncbi:MAG: HAD family hydrolase [Spirochaetales bacterium]|jgi:HAD superfamily hydrolase (TIGR01549 family)|nr:HAD family hydrolase [Spirochaetales bacterium]
MISKIDTILFDLDGTLLPLDQDRFAQGYFELFAKQSALLGYDVKVMGKGLQAGLCAMMNNDGSMTNKERFDSVFTSVTKYDAQEMNERFLPFYEGMFESLIEYAAPTPLSRTIVDTLASGGCRLVLATNPVFPRAGTLTRMRWADLFEDDFACVTTYEDFSYSKPHLGYYREIVDRLNLDPARCLMVGNDVVEDMVVLEMGMHTYLITDCLINPQNTPLSLFRHGSLEAFATEILHEY